MKVLVADDSGTARMFITRCLEIAGLDNTEFVEVENGQEAYERIEWDDIDLLVSDLNMPVMNGLELMEKLSKSPKFNTITSIVITSASTPEVDEKLKSFGVGAILSKPVTPIKVSEVLTALNFITEEEEASW